jgi:hypothetical protein
MPMTSDATLSEPTLLHFTGSAPRTLGPYPSPTIEAAMVGVIDCARRVTAAAWSEMSDPISSGRRRLVELAVSVGDLDAFRGPSVN